MSIKLGTKKLDKGRFQISKELRTILGIGEYDELELRLGDSGELILSKAYAEEKFAGENQLNDASRLLDSLSELNQNMDKIINELEKLGGQGNGSNEKGESARKD